MARIDTIEDRNRLWITLAYGVIPATGGAWMLGHWLYADPHTQQELAGMSLQPLAGGPEKEINTPDEYQQWLVESGYTDGPK